MPDTLDSRATSSTPTAKTGAALYAVTLLSFWGLTVILAVLGVALWLSHARWKVGVAAMCGVGVAAWLSIGVLQLVRGAATSTRPRAKKGEDRLQGSAK